MRGRDGSQDVMGSLPRPGKALRAALLTLFAVWLAFAVAINWGGASTELFALFVGNNELILQGQVWRLVTAPLLHHPQMLGSILFMLLGLYFLSPSLESAWGSKRFLGFLIWSALIGYGVQLFVWMLLPRSIGTKLVPQAWFGALPVVEAVAIAWALSFKGQTVRLMMLVPVSSRTLVLFVVGTSILAVVALSDLPSGLIAPFGGMLAGWLLGGGTPSPLRRWWLHRRLTATQAELEGERRRRRERVASSGLRVIDGGGEDSDQPAPDSGPRRDDDDGPDGRGPDGNLLN
jgi:membrane associated rhomboid family serine protease